MKYAETIQYMYQALPMFHNLGRAAYKKDLTNITALCNALDNPQKNLKCFHIAGTNGKGSVSHMLAAVLQIHGYKTGLYISPHYKDFRERIKINGDYVTKSYVCKFIEKNKKLFEEIKPSFFEMTVAMAFSWFKKNQVDYAVIETGLGGRLDSTNIVNPLMSIITNISWDHSDILGSTLEKIAMEKAGIIKHSVPVLIGRKQDETKNVFAEMSYKNKAGLFYADDIMGKYTETIKDSGLEEIQTRLFGKEVNFKPDLKGIYQAENIKTVLAACEIINSQLSIHLASEKTIDAIENTTELTRIQGRWQLISKQPLIICESAHNEDGIKFLVDQIKSMNFGRLHIVCGFVKDKPLDIVFKLLPSNAKYYFVKANMPRGLDAKILKTQAAEFGFNGKSYTSVKRGLASAKRAAEKKDLVLVTGSIFVVAEVL